MRLDHLLSKELLFNRWPASVRSGSNQFPVGALVGRSTRFRGRGIASLGFASADFVFSSVLREFDFLSHRHERMLRCHGGPGERLERSRCRRCPLRTAEQARASLFFQATKSQRWMPWRQEPMKDVSDCEKLRGAVYWASIRRCPNGETRHSSWSVTPA